MTSLFSIFEPTSSIMNFSFNWLCVFLGLVGLPYCYWLFSSRWSVMWSKVISILHAEFKVLLGPSYSGESVMFVSIFSLILYNNFLGLLPYVFTSTSHLSMTLSLSLPLWISFMLYGWLNQARHMFAHLVPQGTPAPLMFFMVLIETVSNIIRPGTLAVRLAANMIAGHLLLTLISEVCVDVCKSVVFILLICQILLLILEFAVACIQSYVFVVLGTLYLGEVI